MLETVGKKLAKARQAKHLSIEDAEYETRIPHARLQELEDDDYSQFANLTYAKGFLKLYSDYVGVDTSEYRQELSLYEIDDFGADPLADAFTDADEPKKRSSLATGMVLLLLISLVGAYIFTEFYGRENGKEGGGGAGVGSGEPPVIAGKGDEGVGDLTPGAKPPGGLPDETSPPVPEEVNPPVPEVISPPVPEVPEVINPPRPTPEAIGTTTIGGEEVPVLPAVVVEDDELLGEPPVEGGEPDAGEPEAVEVEAPGEGEPGVEEPRAEEPETGAPGAGEPRTEEEPGTEEPGTEEPGTEEPGTDEPGADEPGADEPGADEPGADEPGTEEPGTDEPGADEPGADEPGTEEGD